MYYFVITCALFYTLIKLFQKSIKMKTFIVMCLDESASMRDMKWEVMSGFNKFVESQRKLECGDECLLTLIKFNTNTNIVMTNKLLKDVEQLTEEEFRPSGQTALFDAVALGINLIDSFKNKEDRVIFVVMTDGEENASTKTKLNDIRTMITARKQNDWKFIYYGARPEKWKAKLKFDYGDDFDCDDSFDQVDGLTSSFRNLKAI